MDPNATILTELTPVALDDNTTVKVLYTAETTPRRAEPHDDIIHCTEDWYATSIYGDFYSQDSYRCESGRPAAQLHVVDSENSFTNTVDDSDTAIEGRITRLSSLFRCLPKDMFINKLITAYKSSEEKLEDIRLELFEYTKAFEEFPYGAQVELKNRLHTRNGESVVVKLCKDIQAVLSVIEGAEFSDLTDIMSLPRTTKSRSSQPTPQGRTSTGCACTAEIKEQKNLMAQLQADILLVKQNHTALEMKDEQMKVIKATVGGLSADVKEMKELVHKHTTDMKLAVSRLGNERSLGITSLRNDLKVLSNKVKSVDDQVDLLQYKCSPNAVNNKKHKSTTAKHNVPCINNGGASASPISINTTSQDAKTISSVSCLSTGTSESVNRRVAPVVSSIVDERARSIDAGTTCASSVSTPTARSNVQQQQSFICRRGPRPPKSGIRDRDAIVKYMRVTTYMSRYLQ